TGDEELPAEGLLFFTSIGVFWSPLHEALIPLAQDGRVMDKWKHTVVGVTSTSPDRLEIQAIRVQTDFADFQIDLINDESGIREVFVITQHNIGEQIAHLCESTSLLGVVPAKLNEALQKITSSFPLYSNDLKSTDA